MAPPTRAIAIQEDYRRFANNTRVAYYPTEPEWLSGREILEDFVLAPIKSIVAYVKDQFTNDQVNAMFAKSKIRSFDHYLKGGVFALQSDDHNKFMTQIHASWVVGDIDRKTVDSVVQGAIDTYFNGKLSFVLDIPDLNKSVASWKKQDSYLNNVVQKIQKYL